MTKEWESNLTLLEWKKPDSRWIEPCRYCPARASQNICLNWTEEPFLCKQGKLEPSHCWVALYKLCSKNGSLKPLCSHLHAVGEVNCVDEGQLFIHDKDGLTFRRASDPRCHSYSTAYYESTVGPSDFFLFLLIMREVISIHVGQAGVQMGKYRLSAGVRDLDIGSYLLIFDHIRPYLTIFDHIWPFLTIFNSYLTIFGSYLTILAHIRLKNFRSLTS